jgi:hypothetical protein
MSGGALVARWGSAVVAPVSTLLIAGNLVLVGAAPAWLALALALFVAGSLDAVADVANNAHALRVERRYGRSILNALHAVWSIGAVTGARHGLAGGRAGRAGRGSPRRRRGSCWQSCRSSCDGCCCPAGTARTARPCPPRTPPAARRRCGGPWRGTS